MTWDGQERRANGTKIAALEERIGLWMESTKDYRAAQKELLEKMMGHIDTVNTRCLNRTGDYERFNQHIIANGKEKEHRRTMFETRSFQIFIIIFTVLATNFVSFFLNNIERQKELERTLERRTVTNVPGSTR